MLDLKKITGKNKRGSIEDIFFLMIFLVGIGLFMVIMAFVIPQITEGLRDTQLNDSAAVRTALLEGDNVSTQGLDRVYLILFAGLIISVLVSSFLIDSHPVFIPIYILLLGFAVVIAVVVNNAYDELITNSILNQTATDYAITQTAIMGNFIPIIIGVGVLSMIIIFGKRKIMGERI